MNKLLLSLLLLVMCQPIGRTLAAPADDLAAGFETPPISARPYTWWHCMNGEITMEGITADLEAMKKIGLAGAQMFFVNLNMKTDDGQQIKGDVAFMSPEWQAMVQHAIEECKRLGLEFSTLTGEGFGQCGGPDVPLEEGMQRLVWTEKRVAGGAKIPLNVPPASDATKAYKDIALLAFPSSPGDDVIATASVTTSKDGKPMTFKGNTRLQLPVPMPGASEWLKLSYDHPQKFSAVTISILNVREISDPANWESTVMLDDAARAVLKKQPGPHYWELQVSDDGENFRPVGRIATHGTTSIPETTGQYFRIAMPVPPPLAKAFPFTGKEIMILTNVALTGPRVDRPDARNGAMIDYTARNFSDKPAAFAIPGTQVIDLTGKTEWDAPPGKWILLRLGHRAQGYHMAATGDHGIDCDKLSRQAVLNHLTKGSITTVIKNAGPLVGTTFKNIVCDSWEVGYENWTPLMRQDFLKRRGYSMDPWLPVLAGYVVGSEEESERFLWDFRRTLADLLADNYYRTQLDFAHQHNLKVYAEATGHGLPTIADQLQVKGFTDVPMGEFWSLRGDLDDNKEAASAAHIYGKALSASESFTTTSGTIARTRDPYNLKVEGDLRFCMGVTRFCFHTFAHQPWLDRAPGMTMAYCGPNFDRNNTWYSMGQPWITYISRCQFLLQQGLFVGDVAYYYGEDAPVGFNFHEMPMQVPPGYDFDACNTDILKQMTVKDGRIVLPSGMTYRVLLLPNSRRMTPDTLKTVADLVKAGATVMGPKPELSPSLIGYPGCDLTLRKLADKVWGDCDGKTATSHVYGAGTVNWGIPLADLLKVPPDFTSADKNLHYIHREDGKTEIYFVSNQSTSATQTTCEFRVTGLQPELWHPDTGKREKLAMYASNGATTKVSLNLDPAGSVFVIFREPANSDAVLSVSRDGKSYLPFYAAGNDPSATPPEMAGGKLAMEVWEPGKYLFTTAKGETVAATVDKIPPTIPVPGPWNLQFPDKLGAPPTGTFKDLISWSDSADDGIKYFSGAATYHNSIKVPADWLLPGTKAYLNLGEVKNLAEVTLNGKQIEILWKPPFRADVTSALKVGENTIDIKVVNLWPNRLIGDKKLPFDKRVVWVSFNPYTADSPLLPSGLLGPVVIEAARVIEATEAPHGPDKSGWRPSPTGERTLFRSSP
jgi:hypothetical protein